GLSAAAVAAALVVPPSTSSLSPIPTLFADSLSCNLSQYKSSQGLTAAIDQNLLVVSWTGQNGADLRARFAIDSGQPVIRDLTVKKSGGQVTTLGKNLTPEYHVVSGIRCLGQDQAAPLRAAGVELTPEAVNKQRWYAFWDAPLVLPGGPEMQESAARGRAMAAANAGAAGAGACGVEGVRGGRGGRGPDPQAALQPSRAFGPPRTPAAIRR